MKITCPIFKVFVSICEYIGREGNLNYSDRQCLDTSAIVECDNKVIFSNVDLFVNCFSNLRLEYPLDLIFPAGHLSLINLFCLF